MSQGLREPAGRRPSKCLNLSRGQSVVLRFQVASEVVQRRQRVADQPPGPAAGLSTRLMGPVAVTVYSFKILEERKLRLVRRVFSIAPPIHITTFKCGQRPPSHPAGYLIPPAPYRTSPTPTPLASPLYKGLIEDTPPRGEPTLMPNHPNAVVLRRDTAESHPREETLPSLTAGHSYLALKGCKVRCGL